MIERMRTICLIEPVYRAWPISVVNNNENSEINDDIKVGIWKEFIVIAKKIENWMPTQRFY